MIEFESFFDELENIERCREKTAIDPLSVLGLGALSHVGANLAVKASHGTKLMRNVRAGRLAAGIRGGISGAPQGVGSRMAELWLGPELTANEHIGRSLGAVLRDRTKGQQIRTLKKLRKAVALNPELHHTPILEDVVPGVNRVLEGGIPKKGPIISPSFIEKAAPVAIAPAVVAVKPAAIVHAGVNAARKAVATSKPGKKFMISGAKKGLVRGVSEGSASSIGRPREILTDTLLSPAALDMERISQNVGKHLSDDMIPLDRKKRLIGALHDIAGNDRIKNIVKDHRERIKGDLHSFISPPPKPDIKVLPENPTVFGLAPGVKV